MGFKVLGNVAPLGSVFTKCQMSFCIEMRFPWKPRPLVITCNSPTKKSFNCWVRGTSWVTQHSTLLQYLYLERHKWVTKLITELVVLLTDSCLSLLGGVSFGQTDHSQNYSKGFQREHDEIDDTEGFWELSEDLKLCSLVFMALW